MDLIRLVIEDGIGRISLNTDDKNSFTLSGFRDLDKKLSLASSSNLNVLILSSDREGVFSQGLNLGELNREENKAELSALMDYFYGILEKIFFFPAPVIAELNGHCMGYGAMMAIASDFRIGLKNVRIGLPEVKLGIRVPSSVAKMFSNIVGAREAESHILQGSPYKGSEAYEIGLFDEVFEDVDVLRESVSKFAKKLGKNSKSATYASKEAFRYLNREIRGIFEYDKTKTLENLLTPDALEGISASIGNRRPEFNR